MAKRKRTDGRAVSETARNRGAMAYLAGLAAEASVERLYATEGRQIAARRWRGTGGEIDLIARDGAGLIFIEVKQSRGFEEAAAHLSAGQIGRLYAAASEFMAGEPRGLDTDARFDVALVDGGGRVRILENALCA
ncbi:MAG: hypothetical protein GC186_07415 [Rhodobacteraceae bacterium]|nr:hypothetical protein [Paracoccaceae bacterium]